MADAYLRFTIDGVRLRSYGTGRADARKLFSEFALTAAEGVITNKNTSESICLNGRVKEGSVVKIELIHRVRRKNKPTGKKLIATTEFRVDKVIRESWNYEIYFKSSTTDYINKSAAVLLSSHGLRSTFAKGVIDNPTISMMNTNKPEFKITERNHPLSDI